MASLGFTFNMLDDAAIRATLLDAYRFRNEDTTRLWKKCGFQDEDTTRPFEELSNFSGLGLAARKEEFQQVQIDVPKQNATKRINLFEYAIQTGISESALRFIKGGDRAQLRAAVDGLKSAADSMANTEEVLAADVFGNAFTLANGWDSQPLISSSHLLGRGGTASNNLGAVSFNQQSLETAVVASRKVPDDAAIPTGLKGDKRLLVLPEDYAFIANRILNSTQQAGTANNDLNAVKGMFEIATNRMLPSSSNWFIVYPGQDNGLIALWETKTMTRKFGDEKVGAMWYQAYMMCAFDWFEWRAVQGSSI